MITTYANWQVGDKINICASINEFCSTEIQAIFVHEINVTKQPDTCSVTYGYERGCGLHLNNVELTFELVKCTGSTEAHTCNPQQVYKTLGSVRTNSDGVCGIAYTVTDQDRLNYESQITDDAYKVMTCITNSDGQVTQSSAIGEVTNSITISPSHLECVSNVCTRVSGTGTNVCTIEGSTTECVTPNYTHILEIRIRPWGWYTPNGAASDLIEKIYDIDGWCTNLATSLTGWEYIETIIVPDGEDVLIQSRFKNYSTLTSSINSLAVPAAVVAFIEKVLLIIVVFIIIICTVGFITGWKFFEVNSDPTTSPTYEPKPKDILPNIITVIDDQTNTCLTYLPPNPTCANVNTYATCLKAAHIGVYGTLKSVKPNFQEFQDTYNKYLDIYTNLAATCDETTPGKTPSDILNGIINIQQEYIEELKHDFDELQKKYDEERCWISNPFGGCLISDSAKNTILTVGGILLGGYVALKIISSKKQHHQITFLTSEGINGNTKRSNR